MRKNLWLSLFTLVCSACVTVKIPNIEHCSVAGKLDHGGICAETLTGKTRDQTFEEYVIWLEGDNTHGPAICQSSIDQEKIQTALEQACQILGKKCTNEMRTYARFDLTQWRAQARTPR